MWAQRLRSPSTCTTWERPRSGPARAIGRRPPCGRAWRCVSRQLTGGEPPSPPRPWPGCSRSRAASRQRPGCTPSPSARHGGTVCRTGRLRTRSDTPKKSRRSEWRWGAGGARPWKGGKGRHGRRPWISSTCRRRRRRCRVPGRSRDIVDENGARPMRFFIQTRPGHAHTDEFADYLGELIDKAGGKVLGGPAGCDMVISVGGDGTMLAAAHVALDADVPVVGFNLGTMGFLAHAETDEAEPVIDRLLSGDFGVEHRMTVQASLNGKHRSAVNDVVVEKVDTTRLVVLRVTIDGDPFVTYRADGL